MEPRVGVGVAIFKDGKILLGLRKGSHGSETWSLPGGHLEMGEEFFDCAKRETTEETRISIKNLSVFCVNNDIFSPEKHYITICVKAEYDSGELRVMEPDKCYEWKWFDLDKLPSPLFLATKHFISKLVV
ncbi:NUDIX domain-containing protein [Candidatus Woesearchaeota archaeon]|nr:NUDIX domain-containing protein [Candidatus Woesearchaeota archaeon]